MFQSLSKVALYSLLAVLSTISTIEAWENCDECNSNRLYVGAFGGGLYSNSTKVSQMGTAFFPRSSGGPLAVFAQGHTKSTSTGFGGAQLGYEWAQPTQYCGCSDWSIAPAAEIEAFFYSAKKEGHLINPTTRLPEHDFLDTFHLNSSVILVNAVFSLKSSSLFGLIPYVGGGIGATYLSIRKADSLQVSPLEPGINHFNSDRNDSTWAFAAQAKAGLRYNVYKSFHIFGEYRFLYVDTSNFIFGSTVYTTHVPTSPWNVKVKNIQYNAFAFGIQYDL